MTDFTDDEEFAARLEAIDAEPDESKRWRLIEELGVELQLKLAGAKSAIVEAVRDRLGDKAAEETAESMRKFPRPGEPLD